DPPPSFSPQGGLDFGIGPWKMKAAIYTRGGPAGDGQQGGAMLMLMQVPGDASQADAQQKIQEALEKQGKKQDVREESHETRSINIGGREIAFDFVKGTQGGSGQAVRQVMGVFPGRDGT